MSLTSQRPSHLIPHISSLNLLTPSLFCGRLTGKSTRLLNLGSYNYLGFAENAGPCADASTEAVKKYGVTCSSSRAELGA